MAPIRAMPLLPAPSYPGKSRSSRGFLLLLAAVLFASSCGPKSDLVILSGEAQGSTFTIKYREAAQRDLSRGVDSLLKAIDQSLSLWVEGSTVNAFNDAGETFSSADVHLRVMMARAQQIWHDTGGAFDPTVLPLVKAWGLGKEGRSVLDTAAVDSIKAFVGMDLIAWRHAQLDGDPRVDYRKLDARVRFDPNGIAQGYTVDVLAQFLEAAGVEHYMVEVGGEVRARGQNERGVAWTIQIDKPLEGEEHQRQTAVPLADRSLATSGNYRKFIELDGRRYGHTIDPRSGRPAMNSMLSATIIADDCATADALATAMLVLGPEEAKYWLGTRPGIEAYLIMDAGNGQYEVWTTPGWPSAVE